MIHSVNKCVEKLQERKTEESKDRKRREEALFGIIK